MSRTNYFPSMLALVLCAASLMADALQAQNAQSQYSLANPFIKIREDIIAMPYGLGLPGQASPEALQKYFPASWDDSKIDRYVDMLQAFGFNSIETSDTWVYYGIVGGPEKWRQKVVHLCQYARQKGMRVSLFIWGGTDVDPATGPRGYGLLTHSWQVPEEKKLVERYYDYLSFYAPYVDHIVTHWVDPGGAGRSETITSALERHNYILQEFRARNPKVQSTFSLWFMNGRSWPGYKNVSSILNAGILPADVMIAQSGQFNRHEAEEIRKAGRKVAVWNWYMTDNEIRPSLHVHTSVLQRYYGGLPEKCGDIGIEWHTVDDCCHGLNMPMLYVTAQMMINPHRRADELLVEFLDRFFGPANAPSVEKALRAIETVRCQSGEYNTLSDPSADMKLIQAAAESLRKVAIDQSFKPAFPTPMSPAEYLGELRVQLEVIKQFLQFKMAAQEVDRMIANKNQKEAILRAIERLPAVEKPDRYMTYLEFYMYRDGLGQLRKRAESL